MNGSKIDKANLATESSDGAVTFSNIRELYQVANLFTFKICLSYSIFNLLYVTFYLSNLNISLMHLGQLTLCIVLMFGSPLLAFSI